MKFLLSLSWKRCMSYPNLPSQWRDTCYGHPAHFSSKLKAYSVVPAHLPPFHALPVCLEGAKSAYTHHSIAFLSPKNRPTRFRWWWGGGRPWNPSLNMCSKNCPPPARPCKLPKHPTYRNDSEDGINHTRANGGVDWLLDARIFEDACWVIEHLVGNKRCSSETANREPSKSRLDRPRRLRGSFLGFSCSITVSFLQMDYLLNLTPILFLVLVNSSCLSPFFLVRLLLLLHLSLFLNIFFTNLDLKV